VVVVVTEEEVDSMMALEEDIEEVEGVIARRKDTNGSLHWWYWR